MLDSLFDFLRPGFLRPFVVDALFVVDAPLETEEAEVLLEALDALDDLVLVDLLVGVLAFEGRGVSVLSHLLPGPCFPFTSLMKPFSSACFNASERMSSIPYCVASKRDLEFNAAFAAAHVIGLGRRFCALRATRIAERYINSFLCHSGEAILR